MQQGLGQGTRLELQSFRHHPLGPAQQQVGRGRCSPACDLISNQPHLLHNISLVLFLGAVLVLSVLELAHCLQGAKLQALSIRCLQTQSSRRLLHRPSVRRWLLTCGATSSSRQVWHL